MIFGFSSEGDNRKNADMAEAAGVTLMRSYDISSVNTSTAALASDVLYCAQQGVKMILQYNEETVANGGLGPDMALGNLVSHIASVGPNGTLWNGANEGMRHLAPTHIEVGNEWSYSYRGDQVTPAIGIANTVQRFYNAVGPATSHGMKFICEGEDAGSGSDQFMNKLLETVPTIRTMLDGWTVHGYGPPGGNESPHAGSPGTQYDNITRLNARLVAKGFTGDKIWITENGISTDNGVSLTNNYGWAVNKTYSQAGTSWLAHVRLIGNSLSYSSRIYCLLQFQGFDQFASGTNNDRERYFGVYQNNGSAKGAFSAAAVTLAGEFPAVAGPPSTTPTPGGAVAGGNAPTDNVPTTVVTFISQVATSFLPSADPWVVTGPGTGQSGDFIVIGLVQGAQATTVVSAPAGFTSVGTATEGTDGRLRIFHGYYSAVGPGPYSFDMSGSITGYAVCAVYRGVRLLTPLDATSIFSATTSSTAWASSSITPASAGSMILTIAACSPNASGRTTTVTSPALKRGGAENGDGLYVIGDKLLVAAAPTSIAGTISVAETMAVGILALRAAPVTAPTTETPGRGGGVGDGRAPTLARAASPSSASTAQGIGTASPVYTSLATYPSLTNYPSPFVGLKFRTALTPGGALAGGFAPPTGPPVSQSPTPGGATAGGLSSATAQVYPNAATYPGAATFPGAVGVNAGLSPRTLVPRGAATAAGTSAGEFQAPIPGGATAAGNAPTARQATAPGGAVGAGTGPGERSPTAVGGAVAVGATPAPRAASVPGGAVAAGTAPGERLTAATTPGGATAAATAVVPRAAVPAGEFLADGFSSSAPRVAVSQGAANAGGTAPIQSESPTAGGAVAAGTAPTSRVQVPAGAAEADGFTFSESAAPPTTEIGGGVAEGTAPTARATLTPGGASAAGSAPAPQMTATPTPGGAVVGANAPSASVAPGTGGASTAASSPLTSAALSPGGAMAGGVGQAEEQSSTPLPGGADALGVSPYAWTTVEVGGAIVATNQITGATVLITPGGALAGGLIPGSPVVVSRHFDDDDGPVLAGSFDSGTQRGQT